MTITIIGSGNVGSHLLIAFYNAGYSIEKIYGRSIESLDFASKFNVSSKQISSEMKIDSDLVVMCVPDDAISNVSKSITTQNENQIIAHTSGTASVLEINEKHKKRAVFYPLQTFKKGQFTYIKEVPFCINSEDIKVQNTLEEIAGRLSDYVHAINDEDRKKLHLAAVFINNFINYLIGQIQEYTFENEISFDLLKPLLKETIRKSLDGMALDNQTGPARRNDYKTISQHLEMLNEKPELLNLYRIFTDNIKKHYESNR